MSYHHDSLLEPHSSGLTKDQIEDLDARFATQQTIVNLCCIPSGLAFFFFSHACLVAINQWLIKADGISGYRVACQPVIWWFFPGFGALSLCFEITLQIWALFVGHKIVDLYSDWDSQQPKQSRGGIVYYDARKWLRWMALLVALPIGILTALALNMHTTFGEDGIHEFGYAFSTPKQHSYANLRRITLLRGAYDKHGKFFNRPTVVLDFADGHRWSQSNWDVSKDSWRGLLTALDHKTYLPVTSAGTIEDLQ